MLKTVRDTALVALIAGGLLLAGDAAPAQAQGMDGPDVPEGYEKVSELVEIPEFIPGLGVLYVQPETLPAGPFLAYDRDGELVSTLYMLPLAALNDQQAFTGLEAADQAVDHVDVAYNAGHPGVSEPHYHVILWHVSPAKARALQQ